MSEKLHNLLKAHFTKHRVVFWYDPDGDMHDVFESFSDPDVFKIELANDEFSVKYQILRQEPDKKFLVYSPKERPVPEENWLLDLEMGNYVFSADPAAIIAEQLGIKPSLKHIINERQGFFRNQAERVEPLAALASPDWNEEDLLYGMLSVTAARNKREREQLLPLATILVSIAADKDATERWRKITEWKLDALFFARIKREYNIQLDEPDPKGVLLQLFMAAFEYQSSKNRTAMARGAFLFVDKWREQKAETELYEATAYQLESTLKIRERCSGMNDKLLSQLDIFPCIDHELLERLSAMISSPEASISSAWELAKQRTASYWYLNDKEGKLKNWYEAILTACELFQAINKLKKEAPFRALSKSGLWDIYAKSLHLIDREYRTFLYHYSKAGSPPALAAAIERAAAIYLNDFLVPLSQRWQSLLDADQSFDFAPHQETFFETKLSRMLREGKRVFVLVSDALRWEAGVELAERITATGRFETTLEAMQASLPTYTDHGIAALLPHTAIEIDPVSGDVRIDGFAPAGIEGRSKYLARALSGKLDGIQGCALSAEEFLTFLESDFETKLKEMQLVYIFSVTIDNAGHASDMDLPGAVETELERLVSIVRKIASFGRGIIFITADHGFLYSGAARDDVYMLDVPELEGEIIRDQRYILGTNLQPAAGLMKIGAPARSFSGDTIALIVKGIMKIKRKGASGNFVHGGASIQELAIPLLQVTPLRKDESRKASVSVLGSREITTPSIVLKLFQEEAVGGFVLPHRLQLWFESEAGEIISNKAECLCDSRDPEDVNRAFSVSFELLPAARAHKGRKILLKMHTVAEGGTLIPFHTEEFRLKQIAYDIDTFF